MRDVGAVILAAGESSRFGRPKQLVLFRDKSLLRRVIDAATQANCSPIVVVTGYRSEEVERELTETNAIGIENENWQRGIGTSIRAGLRHCIENTPKIEAIALLVCDQPFVDAALINQLIALHEKTATSIIASAYAGTLGVPALFDRSCFEELLTLGDATGAKAIILSNRKRVAELQFPEGKIDIDTMEDYQRLKNGV